MTDPGLTVSMLGTFLLQTKAMLFAAASGAQGPIWEGQARWGPEGLSRVWPVLRLEKTDRKTGDHLYLLDSFNQS